MPTMIKYVYLQYVAVHLKCVTSCNDYNHHKIKLRNPDVADIDIWIFLHFPGVPFTIECIEVSLYHMYMRANTRVRVGLVQTLQIGTNKYLGPPPPPQHAKHLCITSI